MHDLVVIAPGVAQIHRTVQRMIVGFKVQKYLARVDGFGISFAQESDSRRISVMKIAYAQVSIGERYLELRLNVRKQAGHRRIFCEKIAQGWGARPNCPYA
jgi:hypothetical protein